VSTSIVLVATSKRMMRIHPSPPLGSSWKSASTSCTGSPATFVETWRYSSWKWPQFTMKIDGFLRMNQSKNSLLWMPSGV
jgi:hypothetical protein